MISAELTMAEPVPPNALAELSLALARMREKEEFERRAEKEQRDLLLSRWNDIYPLLTEAIDGVNAVLAGHGYLEG